MQDPKVKSSGPLSDGRISYLFVMVHNFQKMLAFYRDVLGFQVSYLEDGYCVFLHLQDATIPQIALYRGRKSSSQNDNHWFLVIDVNDIESKVSELKGRGVVVGEIEEVPYGKAAKLIDPEGNVIQIHQPISQC